MEGAADHTQAPVKTRLAGAVDRNMQKKKGATEHVERKRAVVLIDRHVLCSLQDGFVFIASQEVAV